MVQCSSVDAINAPPPLEALTAPRTSEYHVVDQLMFQQKHVAAMVKQRHRLGSRFLQEKGEHGP